MAPLDASATLTPPPAAATTDTGTAVDVVEAFWLSTATAVRLYGPTGPAVQVTSYGLVASEAISWVPA